MYYSNYYLVHISLERQSLKKVTPEIIKFTDNSKTLREVQINEDDIFVFIVISI